MLAVQGDAVAGLDLGERAGHPADHRDVERLGDDRDMGGQGALLEDHAAQPRPIVFQKLGGAQRTGHQDELARQHRRVGQQAAPGEVHQQPVGQRIEIGQPLLEIGIGDMRHAQPGLLLDAAHRGLRRETGADRLAHVAPPAGVMGEHAVGFQHLAMLAVGDLGQQQQPIDRGAKARDGRLETHRLLVRVLGHQPGDLDPDLVQDRLAQCHALDQTQALQPIRTCDRATIGREARVVDQAARGDHLGEHRGDDLERLDLLVGVVPARPVLHHQHAGDAAAMDDRHAQEGVVDLLAGLGPVGEVGMALRVGQVDHGTLGGDPPDQALADPQPGLVHRARPQALGREQLEIVAAPEHVGRADLGDDVGGDHADHAVEALLRADRRRHQLHQPAQQAARCAQLAAAPLARRRRDAAPARGQLGHATSSTASSAARRRAPALSPSARPARR